MLKRFYLFMSYCYWPSYCLDGSLIERTGRYQIASAGGDLMHAVVLDTATGDVWGVMIGAVASNLDERGVDFRLMLLDEMDSAKSSKLNISKRLKLLKER